MAQPAPQLDDISCVMIPAWRTQLLLPNVCIAEILPWRRLNALEGGPDWCVGLLAWRGQTVAVIDFDLMNGTAADKEDAADPTYVSAVVMNRTQSVQGDAFYALAATGLPRIMQLGADDVAHDTLKPGAASTVIVNVGTEQAVVPNLLFIESNISKITP